MYLEELVLEIEQENKKVNRGGYIWIIRKKQV